MLEFFLYNTQRGLIMADVVYINEEEGKNRVLGNVKLYVKLLNRFKTDTNLDKFAAFVEAQEWENARIEVHTIKGTAANLSMTELFRQSQDVEAQIKENSLKSESIESLKLCFAETLAALDKVIAKNE